MKMISKKSIIDDICHKKLWDIKESEAINAVKNIPNGKCFKYSAMHYKMVLKIELQK